jgi:hypothetical protein
MLLALGLNIVRRPVFRGFVVGFRFYHKTAVHPLSERPARLAPAGRYLLRLPLHIKTLSARHPAGALAVALA